MTLYSIQDVCPKTTAVLVICMADPENSGMLTFHYNHITSPLGCKAAVHATCLYIHNMTSRQVLLKLDFKNAFNCLRHDRMLMAVKESTPATGVCLLRIRETILPPLRRPHHSII